MPPTDYNYNFSITASFKLRAKHPNEAAAAAAAAAAVPPTDAAVDADDRVSGHVWRGEESHKFVHGATDRGYQNTIPLNQISEFTDAAGDITIEYIVNVQPPGYQSTKYGSYEPYVPYDSKATTGYVGLLNQGATCKEKGGEREKTNDKDGITTYGMISTWRSNLALAHFSRFISMFSHRFCSSHVRVFVQAI